MRPVKASGMRGGHDGGRLLFLLIEGVRRRRVAPMTEAVVHAVGLAFILVFAIYITIGDVSRL